MVSRIAVLGLVAGVGLLFANGFFVTMEYALTRLRQFPERELTSTRLRRAWEMTNRLEIYLSSSKLGITITSIGLGVITEPALASILDAGLELVGVGSEGAAHAASASIIAFAIITLLHVIVGEQAPTYLGVERPKLVAGVGGFALRLWTTAMHPVIRFGDWVAKATLSVGGVEITRSWTDVEHEEDELGADDLRRELETVLNRSDLTAERKQEVINALEISRATVADVMVPRDDVVTIEADASLPEVVDRIREHPHTRYPVSESGLDDLVGVLYVSALLQEFEAVRSGRIEVADLLVEPVEVPVGMAVSDCIDRLQAADQELAITVAGGEPVGLVTITDAFEAITGQLEDPFDEAEVA